MKKICIWGAWYSSKNAGDQAILITITNLIKKHLADVEFFIPCADPEFVIQEHGFSSYAPRKQLLKLLLTLSKCDLFIIGGGTPFYDDNAHMLYCLLLVTVAKLFRVPIMIYASSSQDIQTRIAKSITKFVVNHVDIVSIREPITIDRLKNIGLKREIQQTSDPAITLLPVSALETDKIFAQEGITFGNYPIIGICPHFFSETDPYRVHHYKQFSRNIIENYIATLSQIADYLSDKGQVVFIPMNTTPPDSDVDAANTIKEQMKSKTKAIFISTQYRAQEISGILSRLNLLIGVRLHSLVLASAVNTPIVSISYAPKVTGFIKMIGQTDYMCEIESLSFEDLQKKVASVLTNEQAIKVTLKNKIQQLQQEAEANALRAVMLYNTARRKKL